MNRVKDYCKSRWRDSCSKSRRAVAVFFCAVVLAGHFIDLPARAEPNVPPTIETTWQPYSIYVFNNPIKIDYTVSDPDGAGSMSENISEIKFYYTNDLAYPARVLSIDPSTDVDSTGKFSATIDKSFVAPDLPIFFGIIVKDSEGSSASNPSGFEVDETGIISSIYYNRILNESSPCRCVSGLEFLMPPYPDQFPFLAKDDVSNLLKINFAMNVPAAVSMRIYALDGRLTRLIENSDDPIAGEATGNGCHYDTGCQWDGRDVSGRVVGNGMYIVNIRAVANGSLFAGSEINYTKGIVVMK